MFWLETEHILNAICETSIDVTDVEATVFVNECLIELRRCCVFWDHVTLSVSLHVQ